MCKKANALWGNLLMFDLGRERRKNKIKAALLYWRPIAVAATVIAFGIVNVCTLLELWYKASDWFLGPINWQVGLNNAGIFVGTWESEEHRGRYYTIRSDGSFADTSAGSGKIHYHSRDAYLFRFDGSGNACWYNISMEGRRKVSLQFFAGDNNCIKGYITAPAPIKKCR